MNTRVGALAIGTILLIAACNSSNSTAPSPVSAQPSQAKPSQAEPAIRCEEPPALTASGHEPGSIVLAESTGGPDPDEFTGTIRICVKAGDEVLSFAGPAFCAWRPDRTAITRIHSDGLPAGQEVVDAYVDLLGPVPAAMGFGHRRGPLDQGGAYSSSGQDITTGSDGTGAGSAFAQRLALETPTDRPANPIGGPAGPTEVMALVRWRCGEPGPAAPGIAPGRLDFSIDAPVGRSFSTAATCSSEAPGGKHQVTEVSGYADRAIYDPGKLLGMTVRPDRILGRSPTEVSLSVTGASFTTLAEYSSAERVIELVQSPDGTTGRVRFRGLQFDPGDERFKPLDGTTATESLSGIVSWHCDDPATPPVRTPADKPSPIRLGTIVLDVETPVVVHAAGRAVCVVESDDDQHTATAVMASLSIGGERWLIDTRSGSFDLIRIGPGEQMLGEYSAGWDPMGADADLEVLRTGFGAVYPLEGTAVPIDLGGHEGQWIDLSAGMDCRRPG